MALSPEDRDELGTLANAALSQVPSFLKGTVNAGAALSYLRAIPVKFRRYTLQEIIDALDEMVRNKFIRI